MNVTMKELFSGCLIASIAHAIMTNVYPDLSYEQSWDGTNYSMQNTLGLRGTITFERDYCVGAIRNDYFDYMINVDSVKQYVNSFPANIIHKAYEETLQYLLVERNGTIAPYATSIFWADITTIYCGKEYIENLKRDFILFDKILMPKEIAINEWKEYYDMDSNAIELLNNLYQIKAKNFTSRIVLSDEQKQLIPGALINSECVESLNELNICV